MIGGDTFGVHRSPLASRGSSQMRPYDVHVARHATHVASRERETIPSCWFCPSAGKKSREHIFPKWLSKALDMRDVHVTPMHLHMKNDRIDHELGRRPYAGFVAYNVCADCNNGWMSHLEDQARPLLLSPPRRGRIEPEQARILARWFAKTAAVLNVSQNYRMVIRRTDRHELAATVPSNVRVALSRVSGPAKLDWQQTGPTTVTMRSPERGQVSPYVKDIIERTLVVNLQAGELAGTVVFAARPLLAEDVASRFDSAKSIWPTTDESPFWSSIDRVATARYVRSQIRVPDNPFVVGG